MTFKQYLESDYWGSKGAGILAIANDTGRLLVAMRSKHVQEPGTYGIIGGKIDDDNISLSLEARREFNEETGYNGPMAVIKAYKFQDSNFEYQNFIGIIPKEFEAKTNWETDYFKWVTLQELKELTPKHFGLNLLINNSMDLISKYAK